MEESDEVGRVTGCGQLSLSHRCLVEWTSVASLLQVQIDIDGLKLDDRERDQRLSWVAILNALLGEVPSGSLEVESVDIDSADIPSSTFDLRRLENLSTVYHFLDLMINLIILLLSNIATWCWLEWQLESNFHLILGLRVGAHRNVVIIVQELSELEELLSFELLD